MGIKRLSETAIKAAKPREAPYNFIMGNMAAHPRTFIVIGLLRSGLDPAELAKQGQLF